MISNLLGSELWRYLFSLSAWICVNPLSSAVWEILFFLLPIQADKHRLTQINWINSGCTLGDCPDDVTGFDMTFELGLLECCRPHKVLVADLLRNCPIAIPPRLTNSPSQFQSQTTTKIQPTKPKKPDLWDENLPKWIDRRAWWRGILPERFVAIAPIAWSASQSCCALVSNTQSGKGIDSAKAST